ncbi:hypothetical protein [Pseudoduganella umbonata]|uniref:Uncharacterized protein n=1 Tax=Pseudoduganella umbonata TaxID=864828 RepID=A0A4P8HQK8_9BURK|nr:hypothetical protein [Pseudoduganella umbonata]MBB3220405.1 hypothetical protein [Pseudoduganella umbonata]QCP12063.1 hypothetical protein FCL38_17810 [Pseudoduganella umbonata]
MSDTSDTSNTSNTREPNTKDRQVNTNVHIEDDAGKRLPHERDESPEGVQHQKERTRIEQAGRDIEQGLVDTDEYGRDAGIQKPVPPGESAEADPLPVIKRD